MSEQDRKILVFLMAAATKAMNPSADSAECFRSAKEFVAVADANDDVPEFRD